MSFDFPAILLILTIFTGAISISDIFYCWLKKKKRKAEEIAVKKPVVIEYARAFFPVFLIVFVIRSFIVQPYRVPTGSLEPTIIPGDFILVNQFQYGLRMPVWRKVLFPINKPKRGQITLFHWPVNPKVTFVKRVIGLPGDHISYINKVLYINGKKATQKFLGYSQDSGASGRTWKVAKYEEDLDGVKHNIIVCVKNQPYCPTKAGNFYNLVVPQGEYFMMGDNRDNSDDSRDWGFVPNRALIGKALFVWMSWDSQTSNWLKKIRWDRIGTEL